MDWLTVGDRGGHLGGLVRRLDRFLDAFGELAEELGLDDASLLEAIARGQLPKRIRGQERKALAALARAFLDREQVDQLARLRCTLAELDGGDGPATLGWPSLAWDSGEQAAQPAPFRLALRAEGAVSWVVRPQDPLERQEGRVPVRFGLRGRAVTAADAAAQVAGAVDVVGEGDARFEREVVYELLYPGGLRTVAAVQDSLGRAERLDDFDAVLGSFRKGVSGPARADAAGQPLRAIRYRGRGGIDVSLGATVVVPSPSHGTVSGRLGGRARLGDAFELIIRPLGTDRLQVEGVVDAFRGREGEFALAYRVGVSALSPPLARALLGRAADAEALLERLDGALDGLDAAAHRLEEASLLKPGSLARGAIEQAVERELGAGGAGLRARVADALGIDADGAGLAAEAADWLAERIDDAEGRLFEGALRAEVEALLREAVPKADAAIQGGFDRVAAEIQAHIDEVLVQVERAVDEPTGRLLERLARGGTQARAVGDRLRAFLDDARDLLAGLARGIESPQRELVAAQVALLRRSSTSAGTVFAFVIDADGADFYRRLIWSPRRYAGRPIGRPVPGVTVDEAVSEQVTVGIERELAEWKVGILDLLSIAGSTETLGEVRVVRSGSGVRVTARSSVEQRTRGLVGGEETARSVRFDDTTTWLDGDDPAGRAVGPVGELVLRLTQDEGAWEDAGGWPWRSGGGEAAAFAGAFRERGLIGERAVADFTRLREAAARGAGGALAATATASLRVPPDRVEDVLAYAAGDPGAVQEIAMAALYHAGVERPRDLVERDARGLGNALVQLRRLRAHLHGFPSQGSRAEQARFLRRARQIQGRALEGLDELWTRTGYSNVAAPEAAVLAFFMALQTLCERAVGEVPPIVLTFLPRGAADPSIIQGERARPLSLELPYGAFRYGR